jgi:quercetin dioxygenase-like cupin family protein
MSSTITPPAAVRLLEHQRTLTAFGDTVTFHLTGEDTGGRYTLFTETTQPGGGPPPHLHAHEDECFLVLEGRVSFLIDGEWREVPVGGSVFAPRNGVHAFKNVGDTPCKMQVMASPSGFETFFARCAEQFENPAGPQMERILAIAAEHGIQFA